jgi:hypothetical protein
MKRESKRSVNVTVVAAAIIIILGQFASILFNELPGHYYQKAVLV